MLSGLALKRPGSGGFLLLPLAHWLFVPDSAKWDSNRNPHQGQAVGTALGMHLQGTQPP